MVIAKVTSHRTLKHAMCEAYTKDINLELDLATIQLASNSLTYGSPTLIAFNTPSSAPHSPDIEDSMASRLTSNIPTCKKTKSRKYKGSFNEVNV